MSLNAQSIANITLNIFIYLRKYNQILTLSKNLIENRISVNCSSPLKSKLARESRKINDSHQTIGNGTLQLEMLYAKQVLPGAYE